MGPKRKKTELSFSPTLSLSLSLSLSCEDTVRRQPSTNWEDGACQQLNLVAPGRWISQPVYFSETVRNKCLLLKTPSLWYFDIAV